MKKFDFSIHGNRYEVEILQVENNIATVEVNGTSYEVEIHREMPVSKTPTLLRPELPTQKKDAKIPKTIRTGSTPLKSPLPGTIVKINVSAGDEVKKGTVLLVMEAMKMENNILAERDGLIESIKVNPGDAVLQDDVLMIIA
jgi:glutaconyl-CoA/methylmalonyl-CoA decarboxylase subunit gamma